MYYQKMIGWCCPLAFRPCLRYVVLICDTHIHMGLTQHSAFLSIVHSSLIEAAK